VTTNRDFFCAMYQPNTAMSHEPAAFPEATLFPMPSTTDGPGSLRSGVLVRLPTLSRKQRVIVEYLALNKTITLAQGVDLIGTDIYANACKHVGVTLANMVKRGMIVRIAKGIFALPNTQGSAAREARSL